VGPMGPPFRPPPRTVAVLSAELFGRSLSARAGTSAYDSFRTLPLPAARARDTAALSDAARPIRATRAGEEKRRARSGSPV